MPKTVTLRIDDRTLSVPDGMLIVDAAKQAGIDIPVFCYHPKMAPVGMCRMCLVDVGRPVIDRATNQPVKENDGSPKIQFAPKLETACTTPVSDGMYVITASEKVKAARGEVLEFLLTSHPLDCPVCDKGGECPLQNLTMSYGSSQSRYLLDEKSHNEKHAPLGELIWLDRERCIQCARCTRFQHELVDEPVIGFHNRGRALEIITYSEPGFDSIFSGNTTDICPVGALTTSDFRFGARPWELKPAASICNHCPVGCNLTFNVRREAARGGRTVIKRVMPRQNEEVNEIWICDKGRFAHHYTESPQRLTSPLVRKGDELQPATWDEALALVAEKMRTAGPGLVTLVSGRLSNEDLFNIHQLNPGGDNLLYTYMAGGEFTTRYGLSQGSDFSKMGKGTAILVAASDLHEEAPLWWLRVKQAAQRGATLIVVGARPTRLEKYAAHTIRCQFGDEAGTIRAFIPGQGMDAGDAIRQAAEAFAQADNGVILFGSDGLGLAGSEALVQACAGLLAQTGHFGRPNNGLVPVWPAGNDQGAWEMGFRPSAELGARLGGALVAYVAAADPAGDDPALGLALERTAFVVVQELFLTETARLADVVLPAAAYTEREGSYTSGERRVQRFYPAVTPLPGPRADFAIAAQIGQRLGLTLEGRAAASVMTRIAAALPAFASISFQALAEVHPQWPLVGRSDLYYGGSTYENNQGLGVHLGLVDGLQAKLVYEDQETQQPGEGALLVVPVSRLYDRGSLVVPSALLAQRLAKPALVLHQETAARLGLVEGVQAELPLRGRKYSLTVELDDTCPVNAGLVVRSTGVPLAEPVVVKLELSA